MQAKKDKNRGKRPQRGRPKTSTLSKTELGRRRVEKWRKQKRRQENLVPLEVWITKDQRDALKKMGKNVNALAQEAFALLITGK